MRGGQRQQANIVDLLVAQYPGPIDQPLSVKPRYTRVGAVSRQGAQLSLDAVALTYNNGSLAKQRFSNETFILIMTLKKLV